MKEADLVRAANDLLQRVKMADTLSQPEVAKQWFKEIQSRESKEFADTAFVLYEIYEAGMGSRHRPMATWEKALVYLAIFVIVGIFVYVVVRNEKFADPNIVVALRILLSLTAAVLGALVPGFLSISWTKGGVVIRAGGALALFVLTYLFTPEVIR